MAMFSKLPRTRSAASIVLGTAGLVVAAGAFGACGSDSSAANRDTTTARAAVAGTPTYSFDIVGEYPHDRGSFTQGLIWHEGRMFESTGEIGTSYVREVDYKTGRSLRQRDLPTPMFGEGIVIFGDKLYQLTWKDGKAFQYDWKTFAPTGDFTYDGEGWGLTTDGTSIIMSNGSSTLQWRDPKTFAVTKTVPVTDNNAAVEALNELEWVKGEIWANVWQSEKIARIDPATGKVLGWIDLTGILSSLDRTGSEDVLNGIAYDAQNDRYFVTGKKWPKLFEIKLKKRS